MYNEPVQVPEIFDFPDGMTPFHPVGEEYETFWKEISKYDTLFGNDYMNDKDRYQAVLLRPDTNPFRFDGGYVVFSAMQPGLKTEVHPIILDHKLSVHKELFQDILIWAFMQYNFQRIETFVAEYAHSVKRFLKKHLGFMHEGTLRNRIIHHGVPMNIDVYSILKEEVLK